MKKFIFAMMGAAMVLTSCTTPAPKANLKSDVDTLSYMMGMVNTQGLKSYAMGRLGIDSTNYADFLAGVNEGFNLNDPKAKAKIAGIQIGQQVSGDMLKALSSQIFEGDTEASLDKNNFLAGFMEGINETATISLDSANNYVRVKSEEIRTNAMEAKYGEYKAENIEFLAKNKEKEGIVTTESGLQYRIIKAGKGAIPSATSTVKVHYKGSLIDGTEFDSSYSRKAPTSFRADQVIKGWTEALTMMPVGSKWELYIPQELAYGAREAGKIKPFSTLIFEVELLEIEK